MHLVTLKLWSSQTFTMAHPINWLVVSLLKVVGGCMWNIWFFYVLFLTMMCFSAFNSRYGFWFFHTFPVSIALCFWNQTIHTLATQIILSYSYAVVVLCIREKNKGKFQAHIYFLWPSNVCGFLGSSSYYILNEKFEPNILHLHTIFSCSGSLILLPTYHQNFWQSIHKMIRNILHNHLCIYIRNEQEKDSFQTWTQDDNPQLIHKGMQSCLHPRA